MALAITEVDVASRRVSQVMEAYTRGVAPQAILTDKEMMGSLAVKFSDAESDMVSKDRA